MADPSNGGTGKVTADRLEDFISEALDKLRDVRQAVDETVSEIPTGKLQPGFHLQGTSYLAQRLRTVLNGPSRPGSLAALATSISTNGKHHIISQHANSQVSSVRRWP